MSAVFKLGDPFRLKEKRIGLFRTRGFFCCCEHNIPYSTYPRMSYVDNWRTVSLLNVDYKIGSKASALRLEKTLPCSIHENQCTFVQGHDV